MSYNPSIAFALRFQNMKISLSRLSATAAGLLACTLAMAQPVPASAPAASAPPAAARVHTDAVTGVKYLSGGVGSDEQQAIKAEASVYPFDLVFSRKDGAYLVIDKVTVRDKNRVVLTVANAGPMLLAKLPPGKYTVEATASGKTQTRTLEVAKGAHASQSWALE